MQTPAKYPKPYFTVLSYSETTPGSRFDDTLHPIAACQCQVTFLWKDVKRIEGPPTKLEDGTDQPFVRGNTEPLTGIVFYTPTGENVLYTPASFQEINTAYLNWLIYSSHLVPGSLGL